MVKHLSQCQTNGCHIAKMKQCSVISSKCLKKKNVLQRNWGSRRKPVEIRCRKMKTGTVEEGNITEQKTSKPNLNFTELTSELN